MNNNKWKQRDGLLMAPSLMPEKIGFLPSLQDRGLNESGEGGGAS